MVDIKVEWDELKGSYPKFGDLEVNKLGWSASGELDIIDDSGILWRSFNVKIFIPINYPRLLPVIYETGGILECNPEWHINIDGSCCVGPNARVYRKLEGKITLKNWIEIVVLPFFFDQVHKLEKGFYKGREYSHGGKGLIEDYLEWWKLKTKDDVIEKLCLVVRKKKMLRNESCFCGSGKKYKQCHLYQNNYLEVPIEIYERDLNSILADDN